METPKNFERIVNRTRYSTSQALLLAGDDYWDGSNFERSGRNTFLYRAKNGGYFEVTLTQWQGERDTLTPLSLDEAITLWENLPEQRIDFGRAFPDAQLKEA